MTTYPKYLKMPGRGVWYKLLSPDKTVTVVSNGAGSKVAISLSFNEPDAMNDHPNCEACSMDEFQKAYHEVMYYLVKTTTVL
jgi:hypothetical protein